MNLTAEEHATLRAAMDRIVPRDEWPGATDAGADAYVLRQLAGDCVAEAEDFRAGLASLDAEARAAHGEGFAALTPAAQDALLGAIERGEVRTAWPVGAAAWFARLVELTAEGYYADPGNGGNRGAVSWKMLGYDPRTPRRPMLAERRTGK